LLERCVDHLIHHVLPAAAEYEDAEQALSEAYTADPAPTCWESAARQAKRKAAELAIAIDGLSDRAQSELGGTLTQIRQTVGDLCVWPTNGTLRDGSLERVRGVASAYKHGDLSDPRLPISSDADVLVVGLGFGLDGYGVGKFSGVEVIVHDNTGKSWKFEGDAPVAVAAWFRFLAVQGATLPIDRYEVLNVRVHP
jgi:hypothetical protein